MALFSYRPDTWTEAQADWLADYFSREVEPVLSPAGARSARPFPKILNKSLNFAIVVEGEDGFGRNSGLAVVQAPRSLPRLIRLPDELGSRHFVFLGTIVEAFVSNLFAGMRMRGCYQFRVTRNSDLFVEQEEVDDLLRAVEGELASRRYGDAVRLETAHDCPEEILAYLLGQFALTADDLYKVSGPGEPQPPDGALRSRRSGGAQVRRFHARAFRSGCGRQRFVCDAARRRRAAASPVSGLRPGHGFHQAGGRATRRSSPSSRRCTAPAATRRSSVLWSKRRRPART